MSAVMVAGVLTDTGVSQLWLLKYPEGTAQRVTSDLNWYSGMSIARDGKSIFATQGDKRGGVVRVDPVTGSVQDITDDSLRSFPGQGFIVGNDGRMYYQSTEGGSTDLWAMDATGAKTQLTSMPGAEFFPVLTPSQDTIYYQSETGDRLELHSMTTTGASRRVVAQLPPMDAATVMAPDGRSILLSAATKKVIVSLTGGALRNADLPPATPRVAFSPDGTRIAGFFRLGEEEGRRFQLAIIPAAGGPPVRVFEERATRIPNGVLWTADGRHLVYAEGAGGNENLWLQPVDGGAPRRLTSFQDGRLIDAFARGPAGSIYVARSSESNDIVRIDDFR
jgi:Tol biopolymer transport system component